MKSTPTFLSTIISMLIIFFTSQIVNASELHTAAGQGNLKKVKSLLNKGRSVDEKDENGLTPLHYAAACAQLEIVKYLVSRKANINSQDAKGKTSLHYSCAANMNIPLAGEKFNNSLFGMLELDRTFTSISEFLIMKGAKVNIVDNEGLTPLHEIAASNSQGVSSKNRAKVLLSAGADRTIRDNKGKTPYDVATEKENQPLLEVLKNKDIK